MDLYNVVKQIDISGDRTLLSKFYKELYAVIDELKQIKEQKLNIEKDLILQLDDKKRDELFDNLRLALKSKRPQQCNIAVEEIEKYILCEDDNADFKIIKQLVKKYKFQQAMELLRENNDK